MIRKIKENTHDIELSLWSLMMLLKVPDATWELLRNTCSLSCPRPAVATETLGVKPTELFQQALLMPGKFKMY